jgi:uncharacterized protein (TIRG00374 family)
MALRLQTRKQLLVLIVLIVGLYVIVPQLTGLDASLDAVKSANPLYLGLSLLAVITSYLFAGLTYYLLSGKKLLYFRTVILEVAATFINRLLPAGIGGMGVNYAYLRKNKHSQGSAASIVAVNNLLGFAGHTLLLGLIYVLFMPALPAGAHFHGVKIGLAVSGFLVIAVLVLLNTGLGKRFQKQLQQVRKQLYYYRRHPKTLLAALFSSMGLTTCFALAFFVCLAAFGIRLDFAVAFLVFSAGFAVGNAVPTPGGLGGIEAGLAVGLIAYDVGKVEALAAVLVFRLISFWIPTVLGALAFLYVQQRKIL